MCIRDSCTGETQARTGISRWYHSFQAVVPPRVRITCTMSILVGIFDYVRTHLCTHLISLWCWWFFALTYCSQFTLFYITHCIPRFLLWCIWRSNEINVGGWCFCTHFLFIWCWWFFALVVYISHCHPCFLRWRSWLNKEMLGVVRTRNQPPLTHQPILTLPRLKFFSLMRIAQQWHRH